MAEATDSFLVVAYRNTIGSYLFSAMENMCCGHKPRNGILLFYFNEKKYTLQTQNSITTAIYSATALFSPRQHLMELEDSLGFAEQKKNKLEPIPTIDRPNLVPTK